MYKLECEDKYSEPETEEHINGKKDLYEWIKKQNGVTNAVLEGWIPETKQRPDIMFNYDNKKYVIEYQCSPISTEYIERHNLYQASGIIDIWILGTDKYLEKSEIGKKFRLKEIEKHTNMYYDIYGKSIINTSNAFKLENININTMVNFFTDNNFEYFNDDKRKAMYNFIVKNNFVVCLSRYMGICPISLLTFDNKILIDKHKIENARNYYFEYQEKKETVKRNFDKLFSFRNSIFEFFRKKYEIDFLPMPTQSEKIGFKYDGNYFGFNDIDKFPIVNFCKIEYNSDTITYREIITIDITDRDSFNQITSLISEMDVIKNAIKRNEIEKEYEKNREREFKFLKNKLLRFTDKPIYLLFKEDDKIIPKNIKFKFFNGISDDMLEQMKCLYNDLKFLKRKKASKYVFMIPRKRWRTSSTGRSQYKVKNHSYEVISDFEEMGFNVLTYNDLILEEKCYD